MQTRAAHVCTNTNKTCIEHFFRRSQFCAELGSCWSCKNKSQRNSVKKFVIAKYSNSAYCICLFVCSWVKREQFNCTTVLSFFFRWLSYNFFCFNYMLRSLRSVQVQEEPQQQQQQQLTKIHFCIRFDHALVLSLCLSPYVCVCVCVRE